MLLSQEKKDKKERNFGLEIGKGNAFTPKLLVFLSAGIGPCGSLLSV